MLIYKPPRYFSIAGINIYYWGLMVSFGFILAYLLTLRRARRLNFVNQEIEELKKLGIYILLTGLIGAKLGFWITEVITFNWDKSDLWSLQGMASWGAILASLSFTYFYLKRKKLSFYKFADLIAPYLLLGLAIGRIGCFLNGCCFSKPIYTDKLASLTLLVNGVPVLPTQLFLTFLYLLYFLPVFRLQKAELGNGRIFYLVLFLISLTRLGIDSIREFDHYLLLTSKLKLPVSQLVFFSLSIYSLLNLLKKRK